MAKIKRFMRCVADKIKGCRRWGIIWHDINGAMTFVQIPLDLSFSSSSGQERKEGRTEGLHDSFYHTLKVVTIRLALVLIHNFQSG